MSTRQYPFSAAAQSTPFDYLVPNYPTIVDPATHVLQRQHSVFIASSTPRHAPRSTKMASPTPTGDPVTTSPTPVSDPVTSDRHVKPIMGNVVSLSKDNWFAWNGGKPLAGWIGLDPSASDELTSPNQLRPVHAGASQKGYNYHHTGLATPFSQTSSLIDFQNAFWDHLTDCGMDSIAYLPDPENDLLMTNVIKSHSRYMIQTAKALSAEQLMLYDKYDKSNDRAAVKFVLSSCCTPLSV